VTTGVALAVLAQIAAAVQHDGLAVATDVGNQFHPLRCAHQRATFLFLGQRVVVADVRNGIGVPHIAGPALKDRFEFPLEQRLVEVAGNRKLAFGLLELKTQIRHGGPDLKTPPMKGQGEALSE